MKDLIGRTFHFRREMVKQEPSVRVEIDKETQTISAVSIVERQPREELVIVRDGLDIYRNTASKIYGVPLEEVTEDQRRKARRINFINLFGRGGEHL